MRLFVYIQLSLSAIFPANHILLHRMLNLLYHTSLFTIIDFNPSLPITNLFSDLFAAYFAIPITPHASIFLKPPLILPFASTFKHLYLSVSSNKLSHLPYFFPSIHLYSCIWTTQKNPSYFHPIFYYLYLQSDITIMSSAY